MSPLSEENAFVHIISTFLQIHDPKSIISLFQLESTSLPINTASSRRGEQPSRTAPKKAIANEKCSKGGSFAVALVETSCLKLDCKVNIADS